jgi:D-amino-acid oxidase
VRLPVADVPRYLTWLTAACTRHGVGFRRTAVSTLAVLDPTDLVVVAAGLQSGAILGDDTSLVPVRGQVVRLANPGLTDWYVDDDHPQGLTYVIPRGEDIVCGGTAEPGEWQARWDERTEQGILARVTAAVPALSGLPVLSRDVGLRPGRPTMRLEHVPGHAVPVIACYGHGGAGLSASWGSAEAVLRLADDVAG